MANPSPQIAKPDASQEIPEKKIEIPNILDIYFKNWNQGYGFGVRDAARKVPIPNNFAGEGYGFMGGYLMGYGSIYEKRKGYSAVNEIYADFMKSLRNGSVAFTPYDDQGNPIDYNQWMRDNGAQAKILKSMS